MKDSKQSYDTFVEYGIYRICYDYQSEHNPPWLITIYYGEPKPGHPNLGVYRFDDKGKGIQWAKDVIDARLKHTSNSDSSLENLCLKECVYTQLPRLID